MAELNLPELDENALAGFITTQRWYGSKSREIARASVIDAVLVTGEGPPFFVTLVEARFQPGTHETYQVLLGVRPTGEPHAGMEIAEADGLTVYEALADPGAASELVRLMKGGATLSGNEGSIDLRVVEGEPVLPDAPLESLALEIEQSNSSIVFDGSLILKVYRRLEPGINPELELLRFLTTHGFENIAPLRGWYQYGGRPIDATLGILQDYVVSSDNGWDLALDRLPHATDEFVSRIRRLGQVTAAMHTLLASDATDPNFAPEEAGVESLGLLVASVDAEIERVFADLPELEALASIAARGEELRDQLRFLSQAGSVGRTIRHHGDYHLGQALWTGEDWIVLDFEGEPARSLPERRQKRSPLRDVASMLRSFAYACSAVSLLRGVDLPAGIEQRLRDEFLTEYLAAVDPSLLPPGREAVDRLLSVFELEKSVYELRYELDHRPDWVGIPVETIERILAAGVV